MTSALIGRVSLTKRISLALLASASLLPEVGLSQAPSAPVAVVRPRLLGVFDDASGQPLPGVSVVDLVAQVMAPTSETGTMRLGWLTRFPGTDSAAIAIRKIGYAEQRLALALSDTTPITVILRPVNTLPEVVVTEKEAKIPMRLQSFFDHKKEGQGKFLSPQELSDFEAKGRYWSSDLFRKIGAIPRTTRSLRGGGCSPTIIVDGMRVSSVPYPTSPILGIDMRHVDAFEFYKGPATTPTQYGGLAGTCGVLVFWSRVSR